MGITVLIAVSVACITVLVTRWIAYRLGLRRELKRLRKKALWDECVARAERHWSRER